MSLDLIVVSGKSASDVVGVGYGLKVGRFDTAAISAKMVEFKVRANRTVRQFVSNAVSPKVASFPSAYFDDAIAIDVKTSRPYTASSGGICCRHTQQSLFQFQVHWV